MRTALALCTGISILLSAGCASATFPTRPDSDLIAMSTEQRLDYLSRATQYIRANQAHPPRLSQGELQLTHQIFDTAVMPVFQAMIQRDGYYFASEIYSLAVAREPSEKYAFVWAKTIQQSALADPTFKQLYSRFAFPPFGLDSRFHTLVDLDEQLKAGLYSLAEHGNPPACAAVVDDPQLKESVVSACAAVPGSTQGTYARAKGIAEQQRAAENEALRRYQADHASDVARAQAVLQRCAAAGIPNPTIDQAKLMRLVDDWQDASPGRKLSERDNAASTEAYIRQLEDSIAARAEARSIAQGVAVTPVLTPRVYMALVKRQCGIRD